MNAALLAALTVVTAGLAVRPAAPRRDVPTLVHGCTRSAAATPSSRGAAEPVATRAAVSRHGSSWRRPSATVRGGPDEVARWCTDLARAVRSGATLTAAVREVAPSAGAAGWFAEVCLALDRGAGLAAALDRAATDDADLHLALTVLRACAASGGPPGEPIDRAAATLRARAADLADRRTHSAQARLSAVVMTWLPVAMLGLLLLTSASVRGVVVRPTGTLVIGIGVALNVAGFRWMGRIIGGGR